MIRVRVLASLLAVALATASGTAPALAWGAQGHRIINGSAMHGLPDSLPAFLRTPGAHDEIALLGPEPDRIKGAGAPLDDDDDPGHYVDALDDLSVAGVVKLGALPKDREAYDTALRSASPSTDQYRQGYLPYSIADGWEHLVRDLAYWRVDAAGAARAASADDRSFFAFDRTVREAITLRDIGYWGHFVADASQPLHVSVHFNGWNGKQFANPNNFSESRTIHARFETALVRKVATEDLVAARMPAVHTSADPVLTQIGAYLSATEASVPDVYRLEAAGGIDAASPAARALVLDRLAAGAAELRDLIVEAWNASADAKVGYPGVPVRDLESGTVVPSRANVGLGD
jgi:Arc/MetJ family transcription regulator